MAKPLLQLQPPLLLHARHRSGVRLPLTHAAAAHPTPAATQCQDVPTLVSLLRAGVSCARLNLSWGTREYHARSLANLAEAMKQTKRLCRWGECMEACAALLGMEVAGDALHTC